MRTIDLKKEYIKELQKQLLYEMKTNKRGGIYGLMQRTMAYNSNRIEGSTLTEHQTANIFETGTISGKDDVLYRTKDIEEMTGHFRMFNKTLQDLDKPLSVEIIKQMHYNLKIGVFEDMANGYPCGEFKTKENFVSTITTAHPKDVPAKMEELITEYNQIENPTIKDLAVFHARYENIHPFQDGNGRTGRMILLRESLKHNMIPVIIKDENKAKYYEYLHDAQVHNDFGNLINYFEDEQNTFFEQSKNVVLPYTLTN